MEKEIKNNKDIIIKIIVIAIVVLVIITVILVIVLLKKENETSNPSQEPGLIQKSEITKTVHKIEGKYLIQITNNKSQTLDLKVKFNILDEGKRIIQSIDKEIKSLDIGKSSYIEFDATNYENNKYEVVIVEEMISNNNGANQTEIDYEVVEKNIMFKVKNNSNKKIENLSFEVIYIKNDKIINYKEIGYNGLESNETISDIINTPKNENGEPIEYDKYDITFRAYN